MSEAPTAGSIVDDVLVMWEAGSRHVRLASEEQRMPKQTGIYSKLDLPSIYRVESHICTMHNLLVIPSYSANY